jgi:cytochrome c oxidase subunit 2
MSTRRPTSTVIIVVVAVAMLFLCCCAIVFASTMLGLIPWTRVSRPSPTGVSNGQQIYTTSTSQRGTAIEFEMGGGMMMPGGMIACATCHGADGRGREVRMMMRTFSAPDIRYKTLTSPRTNEQGEAEPIFTEATIKQAITEGTDPDGTPLQWPMPRWSMSAADLQDLVNYLKSLP